jgi:hypothetical protein
MCPQEPPRASDNEDWDRKGIVAWVVTSMKRIRNLFIEIDAANRLSASDLEQGWKH